MYCSGALGACGCACATKHTPNAIHASIQTMSVESILDHENGSDAGMANFFLQN